MRPVNVGPGARCRKEHITIDVDRFATEFRPATVLLALVLWRRAGESWCASKACAQVARRIRQREVKSKELVIEMRVHLRVHASCCVGWWYTPSRASFYQACIPRAMRPSWTTGAMSQRHGGGFVPFFFPRFPASSFVAPRFRVRVMYTIRRNFPRPYHLRKGRKKASLDVSGCSSPGYSRLGQTCLSLDEKARTG